MSFNDIGHIMLNGQAKINNVILKNKRERIQKENVYLMFPQLYAFYIAKLKNNKMMIW